MNATDVLGVVASMLLGAVFLVSGGTKIAARPTWVAQAREMGAPPPVISVLPWVEIVLGAVLLTRLAPLPAALFAALLLAAFTVLVVVRLVQGRHPPCACFGSWSSAPLGIRHVVRNIVLVVVAAIAAL